MLLILIVPWEVVVLVSHSSLMTVHHAMIRLQGQNRLGPPLILASKQLAILNGLHTQRELISFGRPKNAAATRQMPQAQVLNVPLRNISHHHLAGLLRLEVVSLGGLHRFDKRRTLQWRVYVRNSPLLWPKLRS